MNSIIYTGVDVDDKAFHFACLDSCGNCVLEGKCKPNFASLIKKLEAFPKHSIRICYEATYLGFSLYRDLSQKGYSCEIVAPSLIPELKGRVRKTDRLDTKKLAFYYQKQMLTPIHIPSQEDEEVRQILRSRQFLVEEKTKLKNHILSFCRCMSIDYRKQTANPKGQYFTKKHLSWLKSLELPSTTAMTLKQLMDAYEGVKTSIELFEQRLKMHAKDYPVKRLMAFRGIDLLTAMILILEISDVRRFKHPKYLVSYAGMDLREYSSGGHERRYGITRMGNRQIRRAVVESCQFAMSPPRESFYLRQRRRSCSEAEIALADRCMHRLYKKANNLRYRHKPNNVIKVACAREMLGFVWEALHMQGA